jgi:hypothetical protein
VTPLASGPVGTDIPFGIAATNSCTNRQPKRFRVSEVPAESVPFQSLILAAYGRQSCGSKPTSLITRIGVRLFHPPQSASTADLVVDSEHFLITEISCPLAPTGAVG